MTTVEDMLDRVNTLDKIIVSFRKASMSDASDCEIQEALGWVKSGRPSSFLNDYKNYLYNLEVKESNK